MRRFDILLFEKVFDSAFTKFSSRIQEVYSTAQHVMSYLNRQNSFIVTWQSKVGPLPWLVPRTGDVLQGLGKSGHKYDI